MSTQCEYWESGLQCGNETSPEMRYCYVHSQDAPIYTQAELDTAIQQAKDETAAEWLKIVNANTSNAELAVSEAVAPLLALLNEHLSGRVYDDLEDAIRNMLQAYVTMKGNQEDYDEAHATGYREGGEAMREAAAVAINDLATDAMAQLQALQLPPAHSEAGEGAQNE